MPTACIIWDPEFRVLSWNLAAEKIFDFTEAEALGKHPYGSRSFDVYIHFSDHLRIRITSVVRQSQSQGDAANNAIIILDVFSQLLTTEIEKKLDSFATLFEGINSF